MSTLVARRRWLTLAAATLALPFASTAFAGTYLDRAALLVFEARRAAHHLRQRLHDVDLAKMVHGLSVARLEAARSIVVPKEVVQAHPHLLLMLEHYERAADAAVKRAPQRFLVFQRRAMDEEQVFREVLKQLGWYLPSVPSERD